ncbi:hypothetical protein [Crocinitomix catalasitica]|uniref:hypothetical protein n=1 Tax=Crocinitomix catalasitica TaxID=184607 RepID=UPI0012F78517|nr:hypothetical protein [Crocinitomix catalasitica]
MTKFAIPILGITLGLLLPGCNGNDSGDKGELNIVDTTQTSDEASINFESPDEDYHLPSPLQIASIFKKSGLQYNSAATNPTEVAANYTDELELLLNFGVYSADMAYCVMNNQPNEGRKYLKVITELAAKIGMEAVFENADLIDRFNANIENSDSLEILMVDIHERSEKYLDENDMEHQSSVHFSGAWIEGMYLGVYDFENNNSNDGIGTKIAEQMAILHNIIKGLKDPRNDGMEIEWLITDLSEIENTFNNFDSVKNYYENDMPGEINLIESEYNKLGSLIKALRTKITNG